MACPKSIRNIGIIAHIDAGKTTLSERILFYARKIHRMGEVHDGAATMDYMPEEQERGITITSACITCDWNDTNINLVDTPGHVDFTIEVERCLRVLDGAVGVFCAVAGVEPQSETVWRQSERFEIPKLAFINKIDRTGANFEAVLESMRARLMANPVPLAVPLGQGEDFRAVLDLLSGMKLVFDPADQGQTITKTPFTPEEEKIAAPWREQLLEKLAEADDVFLEKWLEGSQTAADIKDALRRATLGRKLSPVYCGSALRNTGVQPLLDGICAFLPSPADARPALGELEGGRSEVIADDPAADPVALVFKIIMENGRKLSFIRLYAGTIREGQSLKNSSAGQIDRVGRISRLLADRREKLDEVCAGDIAAVIGLRNAKTGQTYCAPNRNVRLEAIDSWPPVITIALEPRNADEGKILDDALARYLEEDPTLRASTDEDTGMRMLSGMGELHLDVIMERMGREYGISPRKGQPQVVMRETILGEGNADVVFDRELGKERHQGEVSINVSPRQRGEGNVIVMGDFLPADPKEARKILPDPHINAVMEGLNHALQSGPATGWPVCDVRVTITGIRRTEGLTTIPGCHMAAGQALREAISAAGPVNLEPQMKVEISVPEEFLGNAIGLFNQAQGKVEDVADHAGLKILRGSAPLRRLFGFPTSLRSVTQGRAGFAMSFEKFDLP